MEAESCYPYIYSENTLRNVLFQSNFLILKLNQLANLIIIYHRIVRLLAIKLNLDQLGFNKEKNNVRFNPLTLINEWFLFFTDSFLYSNWWSAHRQEKCIRCLMMFELHPNVLQYRECKYLFSFFNISFNMNLGAA